MPFLSSGIADFCELSWAWQFHHNKALMEQIRVGSYVPYTFHMCWTQTKADKLQVGATAPFPQPQIDA